MNFFDRFSQHVKHRGTRKDCVRVISCLSLIYAVAAPVHAQNLLTNGSFENGNFTGVNPVNDPTSTQLQVGATNITGWTVINAEIQWIGNGHSPGSSDNGVRYLDLTGYHDSQPYGGVSQTLSLNAGSSYTLSLDLGCYQSGTLAGPVGVEAVVGNVDKVFTLTPSPNSSGQIWNSFSTTFTATGLTTTLNIIGVQSAGGDLIGLDNVSITANEASAPEPASLMFLLPLLGVIVVPRYRRLYLRACSGSSNL